MYSSSINRRNDRVIGRQSGLLIWVVNGEEKTAKNEGARSVERECMKILKETCKRRREEDNEGEGNAGSMIKIYYSLLKFDL